MYNSSINSPFLDFYGENAYTVLPLIKNYFLTFSTEIYIQVQIKFSFTGSSCRGEHVLLAHALLQKFGGFRCM